MCTQCHHLQLGKRQKQQVSFASIHIRFVQIKDNSKTEFIYLFNHSGKCSHWQFHMKKSDTEKSNSCGAVGFILILIFSSCRYKLLFSAATDGKIAVWHLTEALSLSADNLSATRAPPIPCLDIPAHQSGINSLAVWVEKLGQEEGGCLVTVASGGDDGQLTVSTIRVQYPQVVEAGGSKELTQLCHSETWTQAHIQRSEQLQLHLQSQFCILLAHAAPLTALKLLSPGLLVSTSSDQRVCLWKVGSTGISHSGVLCSHVADAAGLEVWEGEEENENLKTGLESEQVSAVTGEKERQRTEAGGVREDEEATDEDGGPVGVVNETVDPVCETSDEKGGDRAGDPVNQTQSRSSGKAESDADADEGLKVSCESRKKKMKVGWVLVCGQGLQLLRVTNAEVDTDEQREKENQQVKVTF